MFSGWDISNHMQLSPIWQVMDLWRRAYPHHRKQWPRRFAALNRRRETPIANSVAPALHFDPRLPGVDYGEQNNSLRLYPETIEDLPGDAESIAFASVKEQQRWLTTGQITSRELTDIYLERIERYNDLLKCFRSRFFIFRGFIEHLLIIVKQFLFGFLAKLFYKIGMMVPEITKLFGVGRAK